MKVVKILGKRQTGKTTKLFQEFLNKQKLRDDILITGGRELCNLVMNYYGVDNSIKNRCKIVLDSNVDLCVSIENLKTGWYSYDYVFFDNDTGTPTDIIVEQIKNIVIVNKAIYITKTIKEDNEVVLLDTPIKPKYYLKHLLSGIIGHKDYMYLQMHESGNLLLDNKYPCSSRKIQFTKNEIDEMPFDVEQFFEIIEVPDNERVD